MPASENEAEVAHLNVRVSSVAEIRLSVVFLVKLADLRLRGLTWVRYPSTLT